MIYKHTAGGGDSLLYSVPASSGIVLSLLINMARKKYVLLYLILEFRNIHVPSFVIAECVNFTYTYTCMCIDTGHKKIP